MNSAGDTPLQEIETTPLGKIICDFLWISVLTHWEETNNSAGSSQNNDSLGSTPKQRLSGEYTTI